jgi:hypothetical protein
MYLKFHKHKVKKFEWLRKQKPALNTGLYKTPIEICQDNFKYFSTHVFRLFVYNNLRVVRLAKIKQHTARRKINRILRTYIYNFRAFKSEIKRIEGIAACERKKLLHD